MSLSFRNRISLPSIQNKSIINKSTIPIRALRPSLFLNEIDLIPENFKTEAEENITSRIQFTEVESEPLIYVKPHYRLPKIDIKTHRFQVSLPDLPEFNNSSSPKKSQLIRLQNEKPEEILSYKRKVGFKKSILVINLENGNKNKEHIKEESRPLKRRIVHQKTKSFQPDELH